MLTAVAVSPASAGIFWGENEGFPHCGHNYFTSHLSPNDERQIRYPLLHTPRQTNSVLRTVKY
jgi:hypothetical protein